MKRKHCARDTSDENPNKKLKVDFNASFKGKLFQDLTPENQEIYCEKKKQIMEDVWKQYEQAKEKHEYLVAAKAFAKAYKLGYFKATFPFNVEALPPMPMEGEFPVASSPKDYFYTGLCHYLGLGVSPNHETAVDYFKIAAEQGNAGAQCVMGLIHAEKLHVDHELEQAISWLGKSAQQNYAPALDKLGLMYESGQGVNKNRNSAYIHWTSASNQGYAPSLVNLGLYFSY